jgi:hypothetical protein
MRKRRFDDPSDKTEGSALRGARKPVMFHNIRLTNVRCRRKAKMSALSKVGMSVFLLLVVRFGGCGSDGCGYCQSRVSGPQHWPLF